MKLSKCRNCKKFLVKDVFEQSESWKCLACEQEICVHCYPIHTTSVHPTFGAPVSHEPQERDGSLQDS